MFSDNPASKLATALRILAPFWSVSGHSSLKLLSSRLPAALVDRGGAARWRPIFASVSTW
jgi:hypothetical protein